ncbi:MAG: alginate O-acetyltransferase AlgX-related protein [Allorhizobium sp.]
MIARFLPPLSLVSLLMAGAAITVNYVADLPYSELKVESYEDLLTGAINAKIEASYEEKVPFDSAATHLFNAISIGLFGEARTGALIGRDGWLFTSEEFAWTRESEHNLVSAFDRIGDVAHELRHRGIDLVVVPVPLKADIVADKLGSIILPARNADVYHRFETYAKARDIVAVDLETAFRASQPESLFLQSDTHWSVKGSGIAAKITCASISDPLAGVPKREFEVTEVSARNIAGDLSKFVQTGWFSTALPAATDRVKGISVAQKVNDADALLIPTDGEPDGAPPIALVGTSYSANPLWSFEDQLKIACGADVINYAKEGEGPFRPMAEFLSTIDLRPAPRIVVWEIPVRYLDDYGLTDLAPGTRDPST